jgi:EAL domain-containing protein (putative c-di-GMP-specific phosphodiesterase class I)
MYQAKKSGRGRLCLFEPGSGVEAPKREREQRLAKGLADGELLALFQPLVNARNGAFEGFEVFARWRRPGEDVVSAGDFLPMAHEAGVSKEIDRWMAERALEASRELSGAKMRINIDSKQACDEAFCKELGAMWANEKRASLTVEILESSALPDVDRVKRSCSELASAGIETTIDSFGVGSASLAVLGKVMPHAVKIDAGMLRGSSDSAGTVFLCRSIASSAAIHGMACIGTGIESLAEAKLFKEWGIEVMQGHSIGAPMEWKAAVEWLLRWNSVESKAWLEKLNGNT